MSEIRDNRPGDRPDPLDALIRRERKVRRLPPGASCAECGEMNPLLLEVHHIAGFANDPDKVVVLCLNHHRLQSANQRGAGIDLDARHQRSVLDRVVAWLRGLGLFFAALDVACREMADRLSALAGGLDANYPASRELPEAGT